MSNETSPYPAARVVVEMVADQIDQLRETGKRLTEQRDEAWSELQSLRIEVENLKACRKELKSALTEAQKQLQKAVEIASS